MGFYDDKETALQYIKLAKGYDGAELIDLLRHRVSAQSSVLEIGMGPGVDLDILSSCFNATGSDYSKFFVDRYKTLHPNSDVLQLDAVSLDTERIFDCIYSNKVLHHLTHEELVKSLKRQREILSDKGLVLHSFWCGEGVDEHHGLRFEYQTEATIRSVIDRYFNVTDIMVYTEMEEGDSLYVLATV